MDKEQDLTLDPANWGEFRAQAHEILDALLDHLGTLNTQPVWQPMPAAVREELAPTAPPREPIPLAQVHQAFVTNILPYTSGNRHGRAWGWVRGNGTPVAMLADLLASGINAHVGGGHSAPVLVEEQVVDWIRQMMGMPEGASGLLTTGASMANTLALATALHARLGDAYHGQGLAALPRQVVYCSAETHVWVRKAVRLLGLGEQSLRRIPADDGFRMEPAALAAAIGADRRAGNSPLAVVANAGTVNTGAFDDLHALRALCHAEDLWLHVDGAFGAWLKLARTHAHLVEGLEQADSLALDLHKWMYLPFGTGCLLVRDKETHEAAFRLHADYLEPATQGPLSGALSFAHRGVESSRPFTALRVWMSLKTYGVDRLGALVGQNLAQAQHLASLVASEPELELLLAPVANIVCFRVGGTLNEAERAELHRELLATMAEEGMFLASSTTLHTSHGPLHAIRVALTNHRTKMDDLSAFVGTVVRTARTLLAAMQPV